MKKADHSKSKTVWSFLEDQDNEFLSAYDDPEKADLLIKYWSNQRKKLLRIVFGVFLLLSSVTPITTILCCKLKASISQNCVSYSFCGFEHFFVYSLLFISVILLIMVVQADMYTKLLKFHFSKK